MLNSKVPRIKLPGNSAKFTLDAWNLLHQRIRIGFTESVKIHKESTISS